MRSPSGLPVTVAPDDPIADPAAAPRTRRAILAAALGGLAGSVATALGRPAESRAAAGSPLILGQTNYAGGSATRLNATSSGGAFWMTQNGYGSGVRADSVNGHGGVFTTAHQHRYGLYAQQLGAGGTGAAVRAEGGQNYGVDGTSDSSSGVNGTSNSSNGVYGVSDTGNGVSGFSFSGYAVSGYSISNHAGYFSGSCFALSFVSPAAPTVRLDHPLAPATKVLAHAAVVSDEAATLYSGTVTTDAAGEATVQLPEWFEALNTDLRYQLTTIGQAHAWVAAELADGRFSIGSDKPNTKVCWQLTGVRADAYATAHPLAVESRKVGKERGKYLTPLELGQPESTGVDWEARQQAKANTVPAPAG